MPKLLSRDKPVVADVADVPVVSLVAPRRRRSSLMLVGGLIVVVAALVAAWLVASAGETHRVLVAGTDLKPGAVVGESDVRVVEVGASSGGMTTVAADDQDLVVGRVPVAPVPAGTVLNPLMFVGVDEVVPDGQVLLGAVLRPGDLPSGVAAGDVVSIVSTVGVDDGAEAVELGRGVVQGVVDSGDGGLWVSLRVDKGLELSVSATIAADGLRLGLVRP